MTDAPKRPPTSIPETTYLIEWVRQANAYMDAIEARITALEASRREFGIKCCQRMSDSGLSGDGWAVSWERIRSALKRKDLP